MRIILVALSFSFVLGCAKDTVNLPDLTPRVKLIEAKNAIQDARLSALDLKTDALEDKMADVEDTIDKIESDIVALFDSVGGLEVDLETLREDLRHSIRELRLADRDTRRMIRSKVRNLRSKLANEILKRKKGDDRLRSRLADLEGDVSDLSSRLSRDEFFAIVAFRYIQHQLNSLEDEVNDAIGDLDDRLDVAESDIDNINTQITNINTLNVSLQSQITANTTLVYSQALALQTAIDNIALTPGPRGLPGADGEDGEDGGSGNGCFIEFKRSSYYWHSQLRYDVWAICGSRKVKLINNGYSYHYSGGN